MKRAALYARVSTDAQQKEATIESQLFELKKQIAAAGHALIKEYIDDGYSGTLLDRPALEQLRADLKTDLFDVIYFHSADRIARDAAHQIIIVSELVKYGKQIVIGGKEYEETPEGKLTLTMLGAFSEFERTKIIERTTRGRLHRLRKGEMSSNGHRIYGYHYVRKTPTATATLVINEEQAAIVRQVFEMFASGNYGLVTISRFLEEHRIPTRTGRQLWDNDRIKSMLKNETYTGVRYFNRITKATEANREGKKLIRGKWVLRDREEWIAVKVPAIVSRELFDQVQEKLRRHNDRYCKPVTHYLLSGLVQCGVCGARCSSSTGYHRVVRPSGKVSVYHQAVYRCNRKARENVHDRTQIERCTNSRMNTHILEGKVFEMIRETMLDPAKLRGCIEGAAGLDDGSAARQLATVARKIGALDQERRQLIERYAADQMTGDEYISANRALDEKLERLVREKAKLAAALRSPEQENFVDASIRQFCASANARLLACTDFDDKRQFLMDHVERVIYNRYNITILGFVPAQSASGETKLQYRIQGKIDINSVRSESCRKAALEAMRALEAGTATAAVQADNHPLLPPMTRDQVPIRLSMESDAVMSLHSNGSQLPSVQVGHEV
jgi:site-specific DNA recombinase